MRLMTQQNYHRQLSIHELFLCPLFPITISTEVKLRTKSILSNFWSTNIHNLETGWKGKCHLLSWWLVTRQQIDFLQISTYSEGICCCFGVSKWIAIKIWHFHNKFAWLQSSDKFATRLSSAKVTIYLQVENYDGGCSASVKHAHLSTSHEKWRQPVAFGWLQ
jgi:hypothetical protein